MPARFVARDLVELLSSAQLACDRAEQAIDDIELLARIDVVTRNDVLVLKTRIAVRGERVAHHAEESSEFADVMD
jgi:hypothetical protein